MNLYPRPIKHRFSFPKTEKLTDKKTIARLFKEGQSFFIYPILVKFLQSELPHHRALFSVPKGKIKKAHLRNLIKRRMREAYRLNIGALSSNCHFDIAYIYVSEEVIPFQEIEDKLKRSLQRLSKRVSNQ